MARRDPLPIARLLLVIAFASAFGCARGGGGRRGGRCEPFDPEAASSVVYPARVDPPGVHEREVAEYFSRYDGCGCTPEEEGSTRSAECGPFPCTAKGCYVQACERDGDCAIGLCSSHASFPNGFCVTDDPY